MTIKYLVKYKKNHLYTKFLSIIDFINVSNGWEKTINKNKNQYIFSTEQGWSAAAEDSRVRAQNKET